MVATAVSTSSFFWQWQERFLKWNVGSSVMLFVMILLQRHPLQGWLLSCLFMMIIFQVTSIAKVFFHQQNFLLKSTLHSGTSNAISKNQVQGLAVNGFSFRYWISWLWNARRRVIRGCRDVDDRATRIPVYIFCLIEAPTPNFIRRRSTLSRVLLFITARIYSLLY